MTSVLGQRGVAAAYCLDGIQVPVSQGIGPSLVLPSGGGKGPCATPSGAMSHSSLATEPIEKSGEARARRLQLEELNLVCVIIKQ